MSSRLGPVGDLLAEILRPLAQGVVGQGLCDRLQGVDPLDRGPVVRRTLRSFTEPKIFMAIPSIQTFRCQPRADRTRRRVPYISCQTGRVRHVYTDACPRFSP